MSVPAFLTLIFSLWNIKAPFLEETFFGDGRLRAGSLLAEMNLMVPLALYCYSIQLATLIGTAGLCLA